MKLDNYYTLYTKSTQNGLNNVRPETIKFLEENIGSMLFDIGDSKIFLGISP